MSGAAARVGAGARLVYDGESRRGQVVLRTKTNGQIRRVAVRGLQWTGWRCSRQPAGVIGVDRTCSMN